MRMHRSLPLIVLFCAVKALTACSTTEMVGQWKDPQFLGQSVDSMLVVGRMEDDSLRRLVEDRLAAALQDRGVNAVASYRVFPDAAELDRDQVEQKVRELGMEGVVITRLLDRKEVEIRQPAYGYRGYGPYGPHGSFGPDPYVHPFYGPRAGWPRYYDDWHGYYGYAPPYTMDWTRTATVLVMETNLYEPGGAGLVWSARTRTTTEDVPENKIDEVVRKVVRQMERDGMF